MEKSNQSFKEYYEAKCMVVQATIKEHLEHSTLMEGVPVRLKEAMGYSLLAGGKRLRPVLALLVHDLLLQLTNPNEVLQANQTADSNNKNNKDILSIALGIEMIHTYSLIHDDLPAMDDDDLRRGNPTCHIKYDEATAILAGDALLNQTFELLSTLDREKSVAVISLIAEAAGARGMIGGQMIDMVATGSSITQVELEQLHSLKTGCLIRCSVLTPAVYFQVKSIYTHLEKYGNCIGLAFQVMDDVLEATQTSESLGKSASSDVDNDKSTFVKLMGIEAARNYAIKLVEEACEAVELIPVVDSRQGRLAQDNLKAIAHFIIGRTN